MDIPLRDVSVPVPEPVTIDDLAVNDLVRADIGTDITDIRTVRVIELAPDIDRVEVRIGQGRMDGPYLIELDRIHEVIGDA
jgi:hypothetical protein